MNQKTSIKIAYNQLNEIFSYRKYLIIAFIITIISFIFYALATQMLTFTSGDRPFTFSLASNWPDLIFKEIVFPNYEPIILLAWGPVFFLIPILTLFIAIIISVLLGLNLTVTIFSLTSPKARRINPIQGVLSSLPAFLTGFTSCSPAFLMSLESFSSSLTILFIQVFPFLIPVSLIGLILSLFWSTSKLNSIIQTRETPTM